MITITRAELDDIVESAAERGAKKALASVGLHDDKAANDVRSLRDLLSIYRVVRNSAASAFGKALMYALIGGAAVYAGIKLKIGGSP